MQLVCRGGPQAAPPCDHRRARSDQWRCGETQRRRVVSRLGRFAHRRFRGWSQTSWSGRSDLCCPYDYPAVSGLSSPAGKLGSPAWRPGPRTPLNLDGRQKVDGSPRASTRRPALLLYESAAPLAPVKQNSRLLTGLPSRRPCCTTTVTPFGRRTFPDRRRSGAATFPYSSIGTPCQCARERLVYLRGGGGLSQKEPFMRRASPYSQG